MVTGLSCITRFCLTSNSTDVLVSIHLHLESIPQSVQSVWKKNVNQFRRMGEKMCLMTQASVGTEESHFQKVSVDVLKKKNYL